MARGKRPDPFRTRKLSLSAPMVLPRGRGGRVGRRRTTIPRRAPSIRRGSFGTPPPRPSRPHRPPTPRIDGRRRQQCRQRPKRPHRPPTPAVPERTKGALHGSRGTAGEEAGGHGSGPEEVVGRGSAVGGGVHAS